MQVNLDELALETYNSHSAHSITIAITVAAISSNLYPSGTSAVSAQCSSKTGVQQS